MSQALFKHTAERKHYDSTIRTISTTNTQVLISP